MKYFLLFLFGLLVILPSEGYSQSKNIAVGIALERNGCGLSAAAGYVIMSGSNSYDAGVKARKAARKEFPNSITSSATTNTANSTGPYLVIISGANSRGSDCPLVRFGVGFGQNKNDALAAAKKHLIGENWLWVESRDGFTVEKEGFY